MKYYVGKNSDGTREVFRTDYKPESYGGKTDVVGPFRTKRAAKCMAENPHITTVDDAERAVYLYHDPDGKNSERASWARDAIREFQSITGTDDEDAVSDLLCDLMHLCAREFETFGHFDRQLARARGHFKSEHSKNG